MIDTPVEGRTEHDRSAGVGHGVSAFPPVQARARAWLTARSRAAGVLPTNPRAFRILIFGSSVSMIGTRISTLAFPMLVLGIQDSPLIAGCVAFAAIIPGFLLYMPAGAIVDRRDPRRVMLVAETSRGAVAVMVVVALFIYRQNISVFLLMLAMLAEEILEIFSTLADRRYLNRLMERDKISTRQASVEARTHAAALVGRPIGPLLFAFGPFYPFLADAISFAASVTSLLLVKPTERPEPTSWPTFKQVAAEIGDGVGEVKSDRRIWLTSLLMALTNVVSQALILIFIVEAHSRALSTLAIGIVLGASGVGGALGSYFSKIVLRFIRKRWLPIQMGAWLIVFIILVFTHGNSTAWSAVAMFFMSVTGAIGNIECGTYLTEKIADDMIGKISGIKYTMTIAACAVGSAFGGYVVQESSVQDSVLILAIIVALMAFASLLVFKDSPGQASAEPGAQELSARDEHPEIRETTEPEPAPLGAAERDDDGTAADYQDVVIPGGGNSCWPTFSRPSSTVVT